MLPMRLFLRAIAACSTSAVNAWQRVIKVGWRGGAAPDP
ncbi:hypothetical protein SynA1560_00849 [Synechococcus sp. A15-60]|nr:hypothetical protein SynA1560_00849 [Synechococcus sp. A15-60]